MARCASNLDGINGLEAELNTCFSGLHCVMACLCTRQLGLKACSAGHNLQRLSTCSKKYVCSTVAIEACHFTVGFAAAHHKFAAGSQLGVWAAGHWVDHLLNCKRVVLSKYVRQQFAC
jgi:hypothetical protein